MVERGGPGRKRKRPISRKSGDLRDRPRVKPTVKPVTVEQVKADKTISPSGKEVIIKAIQAKQDHRKRTPRGPRSPRGHTPGDQRR